MTESKAEPGKAKQGRGSLLIRNRGLKRGNGLQRLKQQQREISSKIKSATQSFVVGSLHSAIYIIIINRAIVVVDFDDFIVVVVVVVIDVVVIDVVVIDVVVMTAVVIDVVVDVVVIDVAVILVLLIFFFF